MSPRTPQQQIRLELERKLRRYTRDDLIDIIARMCYWDGYKDSILQRAIIDTDYKREMRKIDEEERLGEIATEKLREYEEIVAPYNGKKISEIPADVLDRAHRALAEYKAANDRYMKAAGIT